MHRWPQREARAENHEPLFPPAKTARHAADIGLWRMQACPDSRYAYAPRHRDRNL